MMKSLKRAYDWGRIETWWVIHNCVSHPICGVVNFFASAADAVGLGVTSVFLGEMANRVHDVTMPASAEPRNVDYLKLKSK